MLLAYSVPAAQLCPRSCRRCPAVERAAAPPSDVEGCKNPAQIRGAQWPANRPAQETCANSAHNVVIVAGCRLREVVGGRLTLWGREVLSTGPVRYSQGSIIERRIPAGGLPHDTHAPHTPSPPVGVGERENERRRQKCVCVCGVCLPMYSRLGTSLRPALALPLPCPACVIYTAAPRVTDSVWMSRHMLAVRRDTGTLAVLYVASPAFGGKQAIASTIGSPVINQWGGTRISRKRDLRLHSTACMQH